MNSYGIKPTEVLRQSLQNWLSEGDMGMALAVTVLVGLMGSSLTWLWFRLSHDRHADPDFASLLKQRRPTFGEHIQSVDDSSH